MEERNNGGLFPSPTVLFSSEPEKENPSRKKFKKWNIYILAQFTFLVMVSYGYFYWQKNKPLLLVHLLSKK